MNLTHKLAYGLIGLATAASFVVAPLAIANEGDRGSQGKQEQENRGKKSFVAQTAKPMNVSVNLGQNGKVEVHGARVATVSGNTFTATTAWGSAVLTWSVTISSSTQITDKEGRRGDQKHRAVRISDINVGDIVDWNGQLDTTSTSLSVIARVVNDRSAVVVPALNVRDVFQGTLQSVVSTTTLPTTLSLKVGGTLYTVTIPVGTPVINGVFAPITLATFQAGDTVRIYGSSNTASTIDALIVRNASR